MTQLEFNLVALGIVTTDELTVDDEWTDATTDAVEEWQAAIGRPETGTVAPGEAVFLPAEVRVVDHPTPIGGRPAARWSPCPARPARSRSSSRPAGGRW